MGVEPSAVRPASPSGLRSSGVGEPPLGSRCAAAGEPPPAKKKGNERSALI